MCIRDSRGTARRHVSLQVKVHTTDNRYNYRDCCHRLRQWWSSAVNKIGRTETEKQVVKVIWHKAASPLHTDGSTAFARYRQCASQLVHGFLGHQSPYPKRNLDRFSRFARLTTVTDRPLDVCQPVSDVASRRPLRSAGRRLLNVPHQRRSTFARRAFSVAGPLVWNSLPDYPTWETRQSAETLSAST